MRRLITLVALAVALPVAALGVAGLFGCAAQQEPEPSKPQKVLAGESKLEYPIAVVEDEFAKTETWYATSGLLTEEPGELGQALILSAAYYKNDNICALNAHALLDEWLFVEWVQVAIGNDPPQSWKATNTASDTTSHGVEEVVSIDCEAIKYIASGQGKVVRLRATGSKGKMTVALPAAYVASLGRFWEKVGPRITPEQPPAPPAADEAATSPATPETPAEAPPAADER